MAKYSFTDTDRKALYISLGINAAILIFSLLYTLDMNNNTRPSYIEVEFGEYQTGQLAEFSEVQNEQVAQRPDPSETHPEEPVEEAPEPEVTPQQEIEEETKPVDLADQQEEIQEDPVNTPETEQIDPNQKETEPQEEEVEIPPVAQEKHLLTN